MPPATIVEHLHVFEDAFKSGNLPKALAPVFVQRKDGVPCRAWSWGNQLLCACNGTSDACGFKQWNTVGRHVKKGSKAFDILVSLMRTITTTDATGQEVKVQRLYGFGTAPVFAVECTEGAEIPKADADVANWLDSLPLIEIARAWGLKVDAYMGAWTVKSCFTPRHSIKPVITGQCAGSLKISPPAGELS